MRRRRQGQLMLFNGRGRGGGRHDNGGRMMTTAMMTAMTTAMTTTTTKNKTNTTIKLSIGEGGG